METGMNPIYKKNLEKFKRGFPGEAARYERYNKSKYRVSIEKALTYTGKEAIKAVYPEGRSLMLRGIYGEDDYIDDTLESFGKLPPKVPFFVIGLTYADLIRKFVKAAKEDCLVVVYEPSIEVFDYIMHNEDIEDLLGDLPVMIYIEGISEGKLLERIKRLFTLETFTTLKTFIAPNYDVIYNSEVLEASKYLKEALRELLVLWHTTIRFTDVVGNNMVKNLRSFADGYCVGSFKGMLKHEVPAFVVSAGPSLNKNIDELKRIKDKGCIIAVDTAIKPLLNRGIIPDFFCIVDGKKPTALMEHPLINEIPLVTSFVVASGIMDLHKGKKIFYYCGESFEDEMIKVATKNAGKKDEIRGVALPTGGSVANTAFSFAHFMDAKEIIFVGQDLALTNGRTHADGTFKAKMDKLSDKELSEEGIVVDGIHGNKVITRGDFNSYREWFETYIKDNNMTNVIDATQGGAKIHGTKIMTLKAAIDKYCVKKCNVKESINSVPKMFGYGAKRGIKEAYESMPEKIREVAKIAKRGVRVYGQFGKAAAKETVDEKELISLADKIKKINDFMNTDEYALFVQSNMVDIDYMIRMSVYQEEEDEVEERVKLAKEGKVFCEHVLMQATYWAEAMDKLVKKRPINVGAKDIQGPIDRLFYNMDKEKR